jgi:hypothetical protein
MNAFRAVCQENSVPETRTESLAKPILCSVSDLDDRRLARSVHDHDSSEHGSVECNERFGHAYSFSSSWASVVQSRNTRCATASIVWDMPAERDRSRRPSRNMYCSTVNPERVRASNKRIFLVLRFHFVAHVLSAKQNRRALLAERTKPCERQFPSDLAGRLKSNFRGRQPRKEGTTSPASRYHVYTLPY